MLSGIQMAAFEKKECEGDSNRDIVECVRRTAKVLIRHAIHASKEHPEERNKDILSERDELRLERMKLAMELKLRKQLLADPGDAHGENDLSNEETESEIERLKEELLDLKLQHLQDNRMLECLQHQELLFQRLGLSKDGENQQMTPNIQLQHVSNLLQATAEVEELQSCLEKSQEERFQLQAICRHLMFTLRGADGSAVQCSGESHGKKASSSDSSMVDSCRNEASLYRHILLSLIGSSGVDWNEDEDLHSLVLSLGQP